MRLLPVKATITHRAEMRPPLAMHFSAPDRSAHSFRPRGYAVRAGPRASTWPGRSRRLCHRPAPGGPCPSCSASHQGHRSRQRSCRATGRRPRQTTAAQSSVPAGGRAGSHWRTCTRRRHGDGSTGKHGMQLIYGSRQQGCRATDRADLPFVGRELRHRSVETSTPMHACLVPLTVAVRPRRRAQCP